MDVLNSDQAEADHLRGLADHLAFSAESCQPVSCVAVMLLSGIGQVFSNGMALWGQGFEVGGEIIAGIQDLRKALFEAFKQGF